MLLGAFVYEGYTYGIRAYDYGTYVSAYLSSPLTKGKLKVDKGIVLDEDDIYPPTWEDLYLNISSAFIKADCYIEESDGKKYKNQLNIPMLQKLGSIISGMRAGCNRNHLDTGGELFNIGYNPMKLMKYVFPNGNITLNLKVIKELHYEDPITGIKLDLEEDGSYSEQIWQNTNTLHKFKLDLSEFVETHLDEEDDWDLDDKDKIYTIQEIIERNPDKNYVWIMERRYRIVKPEELESVCKYLWSFDFLAFDTETTGLKINITSRTGDGDRLVGMIFEGKVGEAFYFPVAHKKIQNICNAGNENYIITKYFKPLLEKKKILCHNGSFDWKVMYIYDICTNLTDDTYILFKVTMWNDHRNLELGLKPLTKQFLGRDSFELSDFVKGKFGSNNVKFWDLDYDSTKYYACPDTDNLLELFNYAMEQDLLGKYDAKKIYEIEVLFSVVIAYQEFYGHCVDVSKIDDLVKAIKKDKEETYKAMVDLVKTDFNPKSSPDMQKVCFDILKLPVIEKTDAGNPSTGKDTRKAWLKSSLVSEEKKEFVRNLTKHLDARTLESNFTNNIDKFATEDGLMFSSVNQFLETGRVSTSDPNYQGYSDTVKKYIIPREDCYGMDADYSTVEARIMVSMAGCTSMVEKLKDPDTDYHRQKASDMFGVPYELVTDALRKMSKGVNFGILYGLGDPNLGVNLYGKKTPENTRKAKHQKELYFTGMEELRGFIDYSKRQGTENHFSTTYFKRRRYFDPRKVRKDTIERQSCNARIQGTAADLYKLAMVRLFLKIKKNGWLGKVFISAFVHDECFLEVHKSIDPCIMQKVLRESMMIEIEGWCPLYTGCGYGRNWYEAKHTEIPVQVQEYMVNTFGETGLPWWDGDSNKLCEWAVKCIMDYKRDRVISYLKNEDNWGKVLKPTENELAHSLLYDIKDGQEVEGVVDKSDCTPRDDVLENLEVFCRVFGCLELLEKANIQRPVHTESTTDNISDEQLQEEEDISPHDALVMRLNILGVHTTRNSEGKKLYFKYSDTDKVLMNLVHKVISENPGELEVLAVKDDGKEYTTGMTVSMKAYPKLLQLYVSRANLNKARKC